MSDDKIMDVDKIMDDKASVIFGSPEERLLNRFKKWISHLTTAKLYSIMMEWFYVMDGQAITTITLRNLTDISMRTCDDFLNIVVEFGLLTKRDESKPVFYYPIMDRLENHFKIVKEYLHTKHPAIYNNFKRQLWKNNKITNDKVIQTKRVVKK
jgi:hypothetical protein